ncbi:MAG: amidohydrolase [Candidatus Nanopelagicales bacterium]
MIDGSIPAPDPVVGSGVDTLLRSHGDDLDRLVREHLGELRSFRRTLHAHPELSGQEYWTTEEIAERLRVEGLDPRVLPSGTGLVCDLDLGPGDGAEGADGAAAGPVRTVVLRADIDALAMEDEKAVPYRSRVPGVAHACGHDVHTAVVLGAGLVLLGMRDGLGLTGRVRLVFEPSEETVPGGAVEVLGTGWFDGVDAVYAVHCDPKLDVGHLGVRVGAMTAASDSFELRLHGPGGHTARPQLTVDLVSVAAEVIRGLPAALTELAEPYGEVSLVFGAVHSGDAANVIPASAVLRGSIRTPYREVWDVTEELLEKAVAAVVGPTGAGWSLSHVRGVPPVVNEPRATAVLADAGRALLGPDRVVETPRSMGGDSFAWYLEDTPGSYARLGVHGPDNGADRLDLHAANFDVDEDCLAHGVRVLVTAALAELSGLRDTR